MYFLSLKFSCLVYSGIVPQGRNRFTEERREIKLEARTGGWQKSNCASWSRYETNNGKGWLTFSIGLELHPNQRRLAQIHQSLCNVTLYDCATGWKIQVGHRQWNPLDTLIGRKTRLTWGPIDPEKQASRRPKQWIPIFLWRFLSAPSTLERNARPNEDF